MRRNTRSRASSKLRPRSPMIDRLEGRELLSTADLLTSGTVIRPMFEVSPLATSSAMPAGYSPAQIQAAYGFNQVSFGSVKGDGTGQTIAIVDAQDDPNIQSDLNAFDAQFGLPNTTVDRVNQTGGTSYPATDSTGGWEMEESLDVEWAHAMAPGATIMLVEASTASDSDLLAGVNYAAAHANVVSMSWGGGEFSAETGSSYDGQFVHAGVTFVASSGDNGAPVSWPAASPNVVAVGGTALSLGSNNTYGSESGWSGSGGGPSAYESQPAYQAGVVTQTTTQRANPDVAYDASPNTGFAVYDTYANSGWTVVGGTSAGAPQWAALFAIADQGRALGGQAALNSSGPQAVLTSLYQNATSGDFHDVTTGSSTGQTTYSAGPGYDYVTGLGSPLANLVVQSLDGTVTAPAPADTLSISSPTSAVAGTSFSVTVTASNSQGVDAGYTGTVQLTSSDAKAGLPSSYTFTAADNGSHTFTVTLNSAGTQSITATDQNHATATQSGITVSPAAPLNLSASAVSTSQINLTWTGSTGATGYTVQRSANGGSSWTTVTTTAAGTTSYADTGLAAGTTYEYRVQATGGNNSGYSNTATATTTASVPVSPGTTDTIWSNSYTPSENEYASGSYDVGVKFTASQAGEVTGVRFYKQTWMGGYTHVGYLWSSSGTMLAKATFTGESSYGWQQVSFSNPVAISANTTYIVSFSTGGGYFGISGGFFNAGGVSNGPLQALPGSTSGGNGVYGYGNGAFPTTNGGGMNFWADVAFSPTASASVKTAVATSGQGVTYFQTPSASVGAAFVAPTTTSTSSTISQNQAATRPNQAAEAVAVSIRRNVPQSSTVDPSWPIGPRSFGFGL